MSEYKLEEKIGEGGMGVVYRALQLPLRREVAIKFLLAGAADDPKAVQRFKREMETLGRLSHGNIIRIYDAGEQDGKLFIAMEYLKGTLSLDQILAKEGPMPLERAVELMVPLFDALDLVHQKGLLHRDIKPSNILMEEDGRPILMDFGLVKVSDKTALTKTGFLVGTPKYMSPEKICGFDEGPESDLWSMGMVFYQMLTGQAAFQSPSLPDLCKKIMDDPHPRLVQARSDVKPEADAVLDRLLEKDPAKRIRSAKEAGLLLQSLVDDDIEVDLPPLPLPGSRPHLVPGVILITLLAAAFFFLRPTAPPPEKIALPEPLWHEEPDRITAELNNTAAGTYRLDALDGTRVARSVTSVIPTPGTTRIVLDGLELGKSYRITLTGPGGKPPFERETITPTADSVARELAIAMERFEPYRHMVQLTSEHYRLWNAEQSKKTKEPRLETLPRDWEAKLAELSDKHHIMMRARTFARLSGVILGSDSVDPAHKRTIRDQGYDFRELEESADLLGMKHAPISGLVDSPLYGEIPQSLIAKPQGWVFTLKHPDEIATLYPGWEAFAKPLKIQDDGMHDRLRSMSDPREAKDVSMEGLLGNIYVAKAPVQLPPREQLARVELHAFIQGAATNLALDLRVSPKRVTSRRSWRRVAQLKPADDRPQHLVHSIPVDILGSDPFHILGELAYCRNWHLLAEALDQRLDVVFIALVYETR